ncbi:MAG: retron St85 family RNA-directed DNA polymerase [Devosia sp.]
MKLLGELVAELGLGGTEILRIAATAPRRYKVYYIPKRHGGHREIAQPSAELKYIQRYLLDHKLNGLPVHDAATGYVQGKNIRQNADVHRGNKAILKMDFQSFFPSIKAVDWVKFASQHTRGIFELDEVEFVTRIFFYGAGHNRPVRLSIGAPTSPALSNILMFDLDTKIAQIAAETNVAYSRYADDITASGSDVESVLQFEKLVQDVISKSTSPKLLFNKDKRGLFLRGQRRMVTGLVVTPQGNVSIGRQRKRLISSLLHRATLGQLDDEKIAYLKGLLGFCVANEPTYLNSMRKKYGTDVVTSVLRYHIPRKGPPQTIVR